MYPNPVLTIVKILLKSNFLFLQRKLVFGLSTDGNYLTRTKTEKLVDTKLVRTQEILTRAYRG